jgi:hypothetical protein
MEAARRLEFHQSLSKSSKRSIRSNGFLCGLGKNFSMGNSLKKKKSQQSQISSNDVIFMIKSEEQKINHVINYPANYFGNQQFAYKVSRSSHS